MPLSPSPSLPSIVLAYSTRVEEGYSAAYRDGGRRGLEGGRRGAVGQVFESPREESEADVPMAGGEPRISLAASKKGSATRRRRRRRGGVEEGRSGAFFGRIYRRPIVSACAREFEHLNHRNFISVRRRALPFVPSPRSRPSLPPCPSRGQSAPSGISSVLAGPSSGIWRDDVLNWPGREWSVNRKAGGVEEDANR